ncbi:uncharacterized protein LOC112588080 isoform X1 [Harpegnathos saltator]|uniref:uncharacterized protein LOC112588080 isoform X1 n=1 Tax=Harpegnathos saltator TaxID=610380 RepID=UPI000DBEDCAB|nr:uncharacterized protein LOC112588080 isoform X1 [Harpegnathos saltator]
MGKTKVEERKGIKAKNRRASKPRNSKKKPQNRYVLEGESESVSTSAKKLKQSEDEYHINVDATTGYRFIDFVTVFAAMSEFLVCKVCKSPVKFQEASIRGLGFKIAVLCEQCSPKYIKSCPVINNHAYDINRRIVFVMRLLGVGVNGIKKFCSFMCLLHPVFQSFYDKIVSTISIATAAVREKSMKNAAAKEKELSVQKGLTEGIVVSGDGMWKKRGFSSLLGVTSLIGWCTGKVIDVNVKSKICNQCNYWKGKEGTAEYEEWTATHEDSCQKNHEGLAGKMEVDAIIEMFQRSDELHSLKYSHYIGDGDSKTYKAIRRNHDSIVNMKKEIWATLYHKISTDDNPQYDRCPDGENSWCSWKQAKARNELDNYQHKPTMKDEVFNAVKPIYEELCRDELLSRCLGGFTQNSNECFNSVLWALAPKPMSSGKKIVDIAADIAVCNFNDRLHSIMNIMQTLNLPISQSCYTFCVQADNYRIQRAEGSMTEAVREARRSGISARKLTNEEDIDAEGVLHGAGIAD